jgi:hypothetical protein
MCMFCRVSRCCPQVQYRMDPCLSEFPSNTFYEGTLMMLKMSCRLSFPSCVPLLPPGAVLHAPLPVRAPQLRLKQPHC